MAQAASSSRSASDSEASAALLAEMGAMNGTGRRAVGALMLITRPCPARSSGRKACTYRATDAGVAEVRRWLTATEVDHTLRLEPLLRSVFFWLMTPQELAAHLDREAAYFHDLAARLRELAAAKDRGEYGHSPQTQSLRVAVEAGIRINEQLGDWAVWAQSRTGTVTGSQAR
jgi:hypothetical protein